MAGEENLRNLYEFLPTGIDIYGLWFVDGLNVGVVEKIAGATIHLDGKGGVKPSDPKNVKGNIFKRLATEHEKEHVAQVEKDAGEYIAYKPIFRYYEIKNNKLVKRNGEFVCSWAYYRRIGLKDKQLKLVKEPNIKKQPKQEYWPDRTAIQYSSLKERNEKELGPTKNELRKVEKANAKNKMARINALKSVIAIYEKPGDGKNVPNWDSYISQYESEMKKLNMAKGNENVQWEWFNESHVHPELKNGI